MKAYIPQGIYAVLVTRRSSHVTDGAAGSQRLPFFGPEYDLQGNRSGKPELISCTSETSASIQRWIPVVEFHNGVSATSLGQRLIKRRKRSQLFYLATALVLFGSNVN